LSAGRRGTSLAVPVLPVVLRVRPRGDRRPRGRTRPVVDRPAPAALSSLRTVGLRSRAPPGPVLPLPHPSRGAPMIAGVFEYPAALLAWLYELTSNYALSIGLNAVLVMVLVTPLILKSTKGMLEMQRLAPEMRRLQNEYRSDRQKLNEEMMKLYQEHKVNPMASCLPLVAQMPVFIIMFRILTGMTYQ